MREKMFVIKNLDSDKILDLLRKTKREYIYKKSKIEWHVERSDLQNAKNYRYQLVMIIISTILTYQNSLFFFHI